MLPTDLLESIPTWGGRGKKKKISFVSKRRKSSYTRLQKAVSSSVTLAGGGRVQRTICLGSLETRFNSHASRQPEILAAEKDSAAQHHLGVLTGLDMASRHNQGRNKNTGVHGHV